MDVAVCLPMTMIDDRTCGRHLMVRDELGRCCGCIRDRTQGRMSPPDVDSWCPPRGINRPLEVTPPSVPEPRTAVGAVRPLVRLFDWAAQPVVDPYLA